MQNFCDKPSTPHVDNAAVPPDDGSTSVPNPTPPDLTVFKSRKRLRHDGATPKQRQTRRLSDLITASFYEACRIGNLQAARQLAEALECEVARSLRLAGTDMRENGDGIVAVWARYELEVAQRQQEQEQAASSVA